ncbi:uncharacterized protein M437DRAFT_70771 [Aureobasidium melanogenum CBS 110374]|uniref:Uncharacterized protein n=1 Tax=Aureobasidium melanogenum (strain CBS 110374) TaxID=1043003 RepID=A0A074VIP2_AURM1|nr:uncharacterized protein M437DRAFT_70771 [Aureobasidium melanogenum CBS 110374]KEQ57477.1 hypothetical protein M437DRAFT_70771 [Aureobasidium melanogenum CBS 110374]
MALTQISPDPTLAEVIQSATTAAFSSRDKVMLRSRDITEHPTAVAVVVGILAILTLVICLWFCIWLRHREKDVSYATPLPSPGTWNPDFSPLGYPENDPGRIYRGHHELA